VHEGRKKLFWLRKNRHIIETCGMKWRRTIPAERDHRWMGAVKKDMLFILYVISIAQVTSREGVVSPGH